MTKLKTILWATPTWFHHAVFEVTGWRIYAIKNGEGQIEEVGITKKWPL